MGGGWVLSVSDRGRGREMIPGKAPCFIIRRSLGRLWAIKAKCSLSEGQEGVVCRGEGRGGGQAG